MHTFVSSGQPSGAPRPVHYPAVGRYQQEVPSNGCGPGEGPTWRTLYWDASLPAGTRMTFEICTGDSDAELADCAFRQAAEIAPAMGLIGTLIGLVTIGILISLALAIAVVVFAITRPINRLTQAMTTLAGGSTDITVPAIDRGQLVRDGATTPLFTIVAVDPVRVFVDVPQSIASSVRMTTSSSTTKILALRFALLFFGVSSIA